MSKNYFHGFVASLIVLVSTFVFTTSASADYRRRGFQGPSYSAPAPRPHYHRPSRNWVAPVIGGLAVGGLAYGAYSAYGAYDNYGNRRLLNCWDEPVVDRWNRIVGYERFCR